MRSREEASRVAHNHETRVRVSPPLPVNPRAQPVTSGVAVGRAWCCPFSALDPSTPPKFGGATGCARGSIEGMR